MALDLTKLQKKLDELKKTAGSSTQQHVWKLEPGKHVVRILPYQHFDKEHEGEIAPELYFHYGVGKGGGILCPLKNVGDPCPICEYIESVFAESPDGRLEKDVWKVMKSIEASSQPFVPVLIKSIDGKLVSEEDGSPMVRFWRANRQSYENLIATALDPEYGDYMDLEEGLDLRITKEAPSATKQFGEITIQFNRKSSPVATSKEAVKTVLAKIVDINTVYTMKTVAEIDKQLNEWLNPRANNKSTPEDDINSGFDNDNIVDDKEMDDTLERILRD